MIRNKNFLLFIVISSFIVFFLIDLPHSITILLTSGFTIAAFMFIIFMYQFFSNTSLFDFYILFMILSPLLLYILGEYSYYTVKESLLILLKLLFLTFFYFTISNRFFQMKKTFYSFILNGIFLFAFTAISGIIIHMFSVLLFGSLALLVFSIIITSRNGVKPLIKEAD